MNNRARAAEIVLRQTSSHFQQHERPWAKSPKMAEPAASHRVLFSFARQKSGWWFCRVHKDDLGKAPISKLFTFREVAKVLEMVRRGRGLTGIASRQDLGEAFALGCGQVMLLLDDSQLEAVIRTTAFRTAPFA